jgi:Protein of unknown function (DUF4127)
MKPAIVLLPLDDRPVNYDFPRYLARLAGYELLLPERAWLGNPWRAGQPERLSSWLVQVAANAEALVLSVDCLAYGGLIPARTSSLTLERAIKRLSILRRIKKFRPGLSILAFSVIQRISRHDSSEEEKAYWATYGSRMFRLSYLEHRLALGEAEAGEPAEAEALRRQIPDEVYNDYRQGRKRNHAVNHLMLDWLAEGVFDYLLLPQDDTADYGWNIAEARLLQASIRKAGLSQQAITYPGADEIGCLLLAAYVCRQAGFRPRVWPRYASVHSPGVTTAYEDRPIHELLKAHLAPLGGSLAGSPEGADLLLFLNAPTQQQGEGLYQWLAWQEPERLRPQIDPVARDFLDRAVADPLYRITRRELESPQRSPEEFTRALLEELSSGRPVALADVLCANGADLVLGNLLVQHPEITSLSAYGGWNTAGNTLGTVLAQSALHILAARTGSDPQRLRAHLEFLFLRLLDDYYYQARERSLAYLEDLPALGLSPRGDRLDDPQQAAHLEELVSTRLQRAAAELESLFIRSGRVRRVQVENIHLPWKRLFEIGFDVYAET